MSRILKNLAVVEDRPLGPATVVERNAHVVCALLVRGLNRKVKTAEFWKIVIKTNFHEFAEGEQSLIGGVLMVYRSFPSGDFAGWPRSKREEFMLEFVAGVVKDVFIQNGLDVSLLEEAAASVVRSQFRNVMVGKAKFRNEATGTVAHIECDQEIDEARIYIVLRQGRERRRLFVATAPTNEFQLQMYFGRVEWQADGTPVLVKIEGERLPAVPGDQP